MSRVLLVCPEPLGHRQPAGIGIRFIEIAKVLRDDGHDVTLLSRDGGAIEGIRPGVASPERLLEASEGNDLAVVQGHIANDFFAHASPIPTVVDLYDPFIIENLHYFASRGPEVFLHDHATFINSVVHGDFFLCASEAQRLFYLGALIAVGRLNPTIYDGDPGLESLLAIAPFGVQKPHQRTATPDPSALLFGGIYDWYDPILAIDAVAKTRRTLPNTTITFTHHPNPELTPQSMTSRTMEHVRRLGYDAFVHFVPWVPYDDRGAFFDRFAAAIMTFGRSVETDLAMRTRVYDFMWGDLPVVSSPAPGTDAIIRDHDAGMIVATNNVDDVAAALAEVLLNRSRFTRGARAFVDQNQWTTVLRPLLEFCRSPRFDTTKELFPARPQIAERTPSILARIRRRIAGGAS